MGKFELTITRDYVADWTVVDAIRELFQNALDQETINPENKIYFSADIKDKQELIIGNKLSHLTKKSLLLGATTKKDDKDTIGQFGEGYKIAILVLIREGYKVEIQNFGAGEVWRPRFVKSRRYGTEILTIFTEKKIFSTPPNLNLTITINGITQTDYNSIVKSNLHLQSNVQRRETKVGDVLLDEEQKGRIYVNGLFVTTDDVLNYGYDFPPRVLKLRRDRSMVSDFDINWNTGRIWAETQNHYKQVAKLVVTGAKDTTYVTSTGNVEQIADAVYTEMKNRYGDNFVPTKDSKEAEEIRRFIPEARPIVVNGQTYECLKDKEEIMNYKQQKSKALNELPLYQQLEELRKEIGFIPSEKEEKFKELINKVKVLEEHYE